MSNHSEHDPIFVQDLENPIELSTKVTGRVWEWLKHPSFDSVWNSFKSTVEFATSGKEDVETDGIDIQKPKKIKLEVNLEHGIIAHKKSFHPFNLKTKIQTLAKKFSSQSNDYSDSNDPKNPPSNSNLPNSTHTANLISSLQSSRKDR
jgi:hypothetical protein